MRTIIRYFWSFLIAVTLAWPLATTADTKSNEQPRKRFWFDQHSKPLSDALVDFAVATGATLLVDNELVQGYRSPPLIGHYRPRQALQQLLASTSLTFSYHPQSNTYQLTRANAPVTRAHTTNTTIQAHGGLPFHEEIIVSGLRHALRSARAIKRNAVGTVDAISALDIRRMPDSNLADAAQRMPAISLNRNNANDGRKISVRGLGPEFNLTLLNGRILPTAEVSSLNDPWLSSSTRAFDFSLLPATNIATITAYKATHVSLPGGSTGATIDIRTPRPLEQDNSVSFGAKIHSGESSDTSYDTSGVVTRNWLDNRLGVLISGSLNEGVSSPAEITSDNWVADVTLLRSANTREALHIADLWVPMEFGFELARLKKQRGNLHTALQVTPFPALTATVEYTGFRQHVGDQTNGLNFTTQVAPHTGATRSPGVDSRAPETTAALGYLLSSHVPERNDRTDIYGINVALELDHQRLELDGYASRSHSRISPQRGFLLHMDAMSFDVDANSRAIALSPSLLFDQGDGGFYLLPQSRFEESKQAEHKAAAVRLQDQLTLSDQIDVTVGLSHARTRGFSVYEQYTSALPITHPALITLPALRLSETAQSQFADYVYAAFGSSRVSTVSSDLLFGTATGDATDKQEHLIEENVQSAYLDTHLTFSGGGMDGSVNAGLRVEKTEVRARSQYRTPTAIAWYASGRRQVRYAEEPSTTTADSDYSSFLPAIHFRLNSPENWVARASIYRSMTRPDTQFMHPVADISQEASPRAEANQPLMGATQGNVTLEPYYANNLDLSLENYYQPASFVSLTYFAKRLKNIINYASHIDSLNAIRDPLTGPKVDAAIAALRQQGVDISQASLFDYLSDGAEVIIGDADNDLATWRIAQPRNAGRVTISGWELAWQHIFGQSGWGVSANYTYVTSSASFQPSGDDLQPVVPGVSDTATLMGFFERDRLYLRAAYSWRDKYLELPFRALGFYARERYPVRTRPYYIDAYGQLDVAAGWKLTDNIGVFCEMLNVTGEDAKGYGRYDSEFSFLQNNQPLFQIGLDLSYF